MKSTGRNVLPIANAGGMNIESTVVTMINATAVNTGKNAVPITSAGTRRTGNKSLPGRSVTTKKIRTASRKPGDNATGRRRNRNERRRSWLRVEHKKGPSSGLRTVPPRLASLKNDAPLLAAVAHRRGGDVLIETWVAVALLR